MEIFLNFLGILFFLVLNCWINLFFYLKFFDPDNFSSNLRPNCCETDFFGFELIHLLLFKWQCQNKDMVKFNGFLHTIENNLVIYKTRNYIFTENLNFYPFSYFWPVWNGATNGQNCHQTCCLICRLYC